MNDHPISSQPFHYSIPPDTDDPAAASPPFHYSIPTPAPTVQPIVEGIGLGAKAALALAMLYALGVAPFFVFTEWNLIPMEAMRDFGAVGAAVAQVYGGALMIFGLAIVFGGVPALVIGVIGGGLIGFTFRFIKTRLPHHRALWYGFWVSLLFFGLRIGIIAGAQGVDRFGDSLYDKMMWLTWFAPNIGAFLGLWWVTIKINERMPTP